LLVYPAIYALWREREMGSEAMRERKHLEPGFDREAAYLMSRVEATGASRSAIAVGAEVVLNSEK
jgi:hypothetical protein